MAEQQKSPTVAEAEAIDLGEFSDLLEKDFKVKKDDSEKLQQLVRNLALAAQSRSDTTAISSNAIKSIKSLISGIDKMLTVQLNEILHAPEVREMEGTAARNPRSERSHHGLGGTHSGSACPIPRRP